MFVCIDCGRVFEDSIHWKENIGEHFGFPAYEEFSGCPYCNGAYTEAYRCDCCEEWIVDDYYKTDDGQRYCEDCIRKIRLGDE